MPRSIPATRVARWSTVNGNLVGINTAIYSRTGGSLGIGFAIPVSSARNVMEQIIQNGAVTRGWIGVEAQEITPELAESFGLPDSERRADRRRRARQPGRHAPASSPATCC